MRTEKILIILFVLIYILKCLGVPGSALVMILVLFALSIVYFPMGFYFLSDGKQNIGLSICTGMVLGVVVNSLLFKLMYWPGAAGMQLIALATFPILAAVSYFLWNKEAGELKGYYKKILNRNVAGAVLAIVLYLIPQSFLINIQHWQDPELARIKIQHFSDESNEEYRKQYQDYLKEKEKN